MLPLAQRSSPLLLRSRIQSQEASMFETDNVRDLSSCEVSAGEVCAGEVGSSEVCAGEVCAGEVGTLHFSTAEINAVQIAFT